MTMQARKQEMIKRLNSVEDEAILDKIEPFLPKVEWTNEELMRKYFGEVNGNTDLETELPNKNYKGLDSDKISKLSKEANIEESLEDLLEMLD